MDNNNERRERDTPEVSQEALSVDTRILRIAKPSAAVAYRLLSIQDLEGEPDPEWLVEGLLMVDSQAILIGPPAEGKTFLALSFALSVASGHRWFGRDVKQGAVVYVAAEGTGCADFGATRSGVGDASSGPSRTGTLAGSLRVR